MKPFSLPFWHIQKLFPRNRKLWLFGAFAGHGYGDNAKALFEYVLQNETECKPLWVTRDKQILKKLKGQGKPVAMANSTKGFLYCLRAGIVFINNHPKDVNACAINGACQVWLWHGLMMKQIGEDARRFSHSGKTFIGKLKIKIQNLLCPELVYKPDYVINTSSFFTPFFCSAFKLTPSRVLITGYPRNDFLFEESQESITKLITCQFNNPLKIIYLPTWRDAYRTGKTDFDPFYNYRFSTDEFVSFLEHINAVFIKKPHTLAHEQDLPESKQSPRLINLNHDDFQDLYRVLKDMDILVTDYSSVYFDFLLTGKPIILTPFDLHEFSTCSRPLYFDYHQEIKGDKATDWHQVSEIIQNRNFHIPKQHTVKRFHFFTDGKSSERVTRKVKELMDIA